MAYAHNFVKLTFGGTLYNKRDIWACGINLGKTDGDVDVDGLLADADDYVYDCAAHVRDWFTSTNAGISYLAELEWVKLAVIGKDGKYVGDPVVFDFAQSHRGALSEEIAPQLTVALSMKTEVRRGPGRDGRIYPPLSGKVDPYTGTDSKPDLKATAFKNFLEGLQLVGGRDITNFFYPIVASQGGEAGVPLHAKVTSVRVGNVIDTQRSRRNAFKEFYYEEKLKADIVLDQNQP